MAYTYSREQALSNQALNPTKNIKPVQKKEEPQPQQEQVANVFGYGQGTKDNPITKTTQPLPTPTTPQQRAEAVTTNIQTRRALPTSTALIPKNMNVSINRQPQPEQQPYTKRYLTEDKPKNLWEKAKQVASKTSYDIEKERGFGRTSIYQQSPITTTRQTIQSAIATPINVGGYFEKNPVEAAIAIGSGIVVGVVTKSPTLGAGASEALTALALPYIIADTSFKFREETSTGGTGLFTIGKTGTDFALFGAGTKVGGKVGGFLEEKGLMLNYENIKLPYSGKQTTIKKVEMTPKEYAENLLNQGKLKSIEYKELGENAGLYYPKQNKIEIDKALLNPKYEKGLQRTFAHEVTHAETPKFIMRESNKFEDFLLDIDINEKTANLLKPSEIIARRGENRIFKIEKEIPITEKEIYKGFTLGERKLTGKVEDLTDITFDKYNPVTKFETKIAREAAANKYSTEELKIFDLSRDLLKETYGRKAENVRNYPEITGTLGKKGNKAVTDLTRKENALNYGSFTAEPQMKEGALGRLPKDRDIQFNFGNEKTERITTDLAKTLNRLGENVRVSKENPTLIETIKGEHAVDIHSNEVSLDAEIPKSGGLGYQFGQKPIKIEGTKAMRLSEFGARKATSSLTFRESGFAPEPHRMKDWGDFVVSQESLVKSPEGKLKITELKGLLEKKGIDLIPSSANEFIITSTPKTPSASTSFGITKSYSIVFPKSVSPSISSQSIKSPSVSIPSISPSTPSRSPYITKYPSVSPRTSPSVSIPSYSPRSKSPSPSIPSPSIPSPSIPSPSIPSPSIPSPSIPSPSIPSPSIPSPSIPSPSIPSKFYDFNVKKDILPPPIGMDLNLGRGTLSAKAKSPKYGYLPSIEAEIFNIRGKRGRGWESGLVLRPL